MKSLAEDVERFDQDDEWLERITTRFDHVDERFERLEERVDKSLHALGGSLARLERKLDRILALSVESRGRNRQ